MRHTIDHPPARPSPGVLSVSVRCHKLWISIVVTGELDLATVGFLEGSIDPYRDRQGLLLFDLSGVTFVDIVGIKPILEVCSAGEARIGVTSESVRRLLRLLNGFHSAESWFAAPTG